MLERPDIGNTANGRPRQTAGKTKRCQEFFEKFGKKSFKKNVRRKRQWFVILTDNLVVIILENDKFKKKLLLTNIRNSKKSQYHEQVTNE